MKYEESACGEVYFTFEEDDSDIRKELNEKFSQTGFVSVNAVAINPETFELKAECLFHFDVQYYPFKNDELLKTLKGKLKELNYA